MFYAHFVLAKKGPLARIWLAAHWDKKLTKAHVFETDIQKSVEDILHPKVKIALRTSGHLLLGVVRIYSRKAKYLLADCNEAFVKIKMAFRPGMVDLPEENREAAFQAITLPEVFHDFDANVPDLNDAEMQAQFSLNQSRAEEITMREDYCQLPALSHDDADGFGDIGFGDSEPLEMRDASNADHMLDPGSFFGDKTNDRRSFPSVSRSVRVAPDSPIRDDGFGGSIRDDVSGGGLFEGGLFDDAPMGDLPSPRDVSGDVSRAKNRERQPSGEAPVETAAADDSDDDRDAFGGPMSVGAPSDTSSRPNSPLAAAEEPGINEMALSPPPLNKKDKKEEAPEREMLPPPPVDQTALLPNEEEGFALAPVDATVVKGWGRHKRKRKLVIDEVKNISGEEMKSQLSDTSDIVITLDLAPPTRRLMHWKETGGVEKLFALPGRPIPNRSLFKDYQRHLISQPSDADEFSPSSEADKENQLSFDQPRAPSVMEPIRETYRREMTPELTTPQSTTRRGRKRKTAADIEAEAEEHQKRRQEQYMSLLAPSPVPPPPTTPQVPPPYAATPTFPALQTPSLVEQSLPSMMAPEETPTVDILATAVQPLSVAPPPPAPEVVTPTPPAPEPALPLPVVPDMDNMGFDQSMMNLGMESDMYGGLPAQTPGALSERAPPTPWHDDYEMAPSVGPLDEQQTDETYEQFEERVLNKRAAHMYHLVRSKLEHVEPLPFSDMTYRNNKKQVAQKFYTLLVLKKHQAVELSQNNSYDEIYVSKGPKFDSPTL